MAFVTLGTDTGDSAANDPRMAAMRCPACSLVGLAEVEGRLACPSCRAEFGSIDGAPDLAPHLPHDPASAAEPAERWITPRVRQSLVQAWTGLSYGEEAAWIRRHCVPVEGPVLELACGHGREARVLASSLGKGRVIALDIRRATLEKARELSQGLDIRFVRGDATRLPFGDSTLGAVDCFGALHLIPDVRTAILEVGRVLAPGGSFTGQALMVRSSLGSALIRGALRPLASALDEERFAFWCAEAGLENLALEHRRGMTLFSATRK